MPGQLCRPHPRAPEGKAQLVQGLSSTSQLRRLIVEDGGRLSLAWGQLVSQGLWYEWSYIIPRSPPCDLF